MTCVRRSFEGLKSAAIWSNFGCLKLNWNRENYKNSIRLSTRLAWWVVWKNSRGKKCPKVTLDENLLQLHYWVINPRVHGKIPTWCICVNPDFQLDTFWELIKDNYIFMLWKSYMFAKRKITILILFTYIICLFR